MTMTRRGLLFGAVLAGVSAACSGISDPGQQAPSPARVSPAASTLSAVTVGTAVRELPAVQVTDANGKPLSGVTVMFQVTGGASSGDSVVTNSAGVARLGSWTIPTKAGENVASAYVRPLAPLRFTVIGTAGPPAFAVKAAGDNTVTFPGLPVPVLPRVKVLDTFANPVAGVPVQFKVVRGASSLAGAETVTDSAGLASPTRWTVDQLGEAVVVAEVQGLPSLTFVTTQIASMFPCGTALAMGAQTSIASNLGASDCRTSDGAYFKLVRVTQSSALASLITLESPGLDTYLQLQTIAGEPIAIGNQNNSNSGSSLKAILPQGSYVIIVGSRRPGATGPFSLGYSVTDPTDGCDDTYIAPGFAIDQYMSNKYCPAKPTWVDRYRVHLVPGRSVTLRIDDKSYNGPVAQLFDVTGKAVAFEEVQQFYTHTITFTAPADGFYTFQVTAADKELIEYLLTVK